jgi:hypothetical protein
VILAKTTPADPLSDMTSDSGQPPTPESTASLVTGVLLGAGGFYTVTNSAVATTVITALAVALAAFARREGGTGR